jgi:hypothetical protein
MNSVAQAAAMATVLAKARLTSEAEKLRKANHEEINMSIEDLVDTDQLLDEGDESESFPLDLSLSSQPLFNVRKWRKLQSSKRGRPEFKIPKRFLNAKTPLDSTSLVDSSKPLISPSLLPVQRPPLNRRSSFSEPPSFALPDSFDLPPIFTEFGELACGPLKRRKRV